MNNILNITPVYADALGNQISSQITNVTSQTTISGLVNSLISLAIPLGVLCAIGLMIVAGYNMITSQGNPEKLTEAKEIATNAIIGFALIALSVAILLLIQNTLKIPGVTP